MPNDLRVIEANLQPLRPKLQEVLAASNIPVERLMRTVIVSLERMPALRDCTMESIQAAAMTAAVLGLEVDGVTGQGYLIPFRDRGVAKAQFVIGYKGFNTLAARSGYTVSAGIVREGDDFDYQFGTDAKLLHIPKPGPKIDRPIQYAYAVANSFKRPPVIVVLSKAEIDAVKDRSPGARRQDSPWNDPQIGYPAMAEKTARRRLARSMPLNTMQLAAAYDHAVDQGEYAHIEPTKGLVTYPPDEGPVAITGLPGPEKPPSRWVWIKSDGHTLEYDTPHDWEEAIKDKYDKYTSVTAKQLLERMADVFNDLTALDDSEGGVVACRVFTTLNNIVDGKHGY